MILDLPTPIERVTICGEDFLLKRDDLTHPDFSGNKARKFYSVLDAELPDIERIVSYGSNQSNAMYSLSVLSKMRGWEFEYFVDHIPALLKKSPVGNYRAALLNGTVFRETGCGNDGTRKLAQRASGGKNTLYIEEGGRQRDSEEGIRMLAEEIHVWQREKGIEVLTLFLPSGTGTTALYLSKYMNLFSESSEYHCRVVTTPCVGDTAYLKKQFAMLERDESFWPEIADLDKKYHFGKLYREFYENWIELRKECGVEFDLLYDPKGWMVLRSIRDRLDGEVLYLHQGGIKGNESMLERYRRRFPDLAHQGIEFPTLLKSGGI